MYKRNMFTLCLSVLLCVSAVTHCADPHQTGKSARAEQFRESYQEWYRDCFGKEMPADMPHSFVASCKASDGTYLIVNSDGMRPCIRVGDLYGEFQDVHDVKGSILQCWEQGQECIVIAAWLELVKGVLMVKEEKHLVTEAKYLLMFGSKDKIEQGILDNKEWSLKDLLNKSPDIPENARLQIVNAAAWNHSLKVNNRHTVYTERVR